MYIAVIVSYSKASALAGSTAPAPPPGAPLASVLALASSLNASSPTITDLRVWFSNLHVDIDEARWSCTRRGSAGRGERPLTPSAEGWRACATQPTQVAEVSQHIIGLYSFWSVMEGDAREVSVAEVVQRLRNSAR